jgi:hypothetical protein
VAKRSTRRASRAQRGGSRLRALPWAALLQLAVALSDRWRSLSQKDRARLTELLRSSRGRIGTLDGREREELRKLVRKLDLKGVGRDLVPLVRGRGRRRR